MNKMIAILICLVTVFSLAACGKNSEAAFTETENKTIVANDGTEYTYIGLEGIVWCIGEWDFIGHVAGEKESFKHLSGEIITGMYSVNGKRDVLVRYFPNNEFAAMYVKSDLLKTEITLENCIRFGFIDGMLYNTGKTTQLSNGITECQQFINEIQSGQTAEEAGLYDLVRQPDGKLVNCYTYGYVCGVVQEDINIVIPMRVTSFDDKAYSIEIDGINYVLPIEWLDKLTK